MFRVGFQYTREQSQPEQQLETKEYSLPTTVNIIRRDSFPKYFFLFPFWFLLCPISCSGECFFFYSLVVSRCSNPHPKNKASVLSNSHFSVAQLCPVISGTKGRSPRTASWSSIFSFLSNCNRKVWDKALFPKRHYFCQPIAPIIIQLLIFTFLNKSLIFFLK